MERPKPTKKIINAVTGENYGFIMGLHHGLNETPSLASVYPFLDFDETVAFAASSWKSRETGNITVYNDLYRTFSGVFNRGMSWLNANKNIPTKLRDTHRIFNPFEGRDLEDRLKNVDPKIVQKLVSELIDAPNTYVFEGLYQGEKMRRGGDNQGLEPMSFHRAYPPSKLKYSKEERMTKLRKPFVKEIERLMDRYPTEYSPRLKQGSLL